MQFNYALEKKRFDQEWEKTEKAYIAAGMSKTAIEVMREYDWSLFKQRRIISVHEQTMASSDFDDDDSDDSYSSLFNKFINAMTTEDDDSSHHSRYWWIEEIESPILAKELHSISDEFLELITLVYIEGYSQHEAASKMGIPLRTVERRLSTVKKIFRKFY